MNRIRGTAPDGDHGDKSEEAKLRWFGKKMMSCQEGGLEEEVQGGREEGYKYGLCE